MLLADGPRGSAERPCLRGPAPATPSGLALRAHQESGSPGPACPASCSLPGRLARTARVPPCLGSCLLLLPGRLESCPHFSRERTRTQTSMLPVRGGGLPRTPLGSPRWGWRLKGGCLCPRAGGPLESPPGGHKPGSQPSVLGSCPGGRGTLTPPQRPGGGCPRRSLSCTQAQGGERWWWPEAGTLPAPG